MHPKCKKLESCDLSGLANKVLYTSIIKFSLKKKKKRPDYEKGAKSKAHKSTARLDRSA